MINSVKSNRVVRGLLLAGSWSFLSWFSAQAEPRTGGEHGAAKSFAAVVVGVADADAALDFYTSVLGLKLVREVNSEKYREKILSMPSGEGTKVVLFQTLIPGPLPSTRIVFYSDDVHGVIGEMKDKGLEILIEPSSAPEVPAVVGIAKDADGTVLEFIQLN